MRIPANSTPFDETETHYVDCQYYDKCAEDGAITISRPIGIPLPQWEDIKNLSDDDLRVKLDKKRKQKAEKAAAADIPKSEVPRCTKIALPGGRVVYRL